MAFWLLAWQGASMALAAAYPHGALLLASPLRAALRLLELLPEPLFWRAVGNSSLRILGGFLLSGALAVGLAALAAGRPWLQDLLAGWEGEDPQTLAGLILSESVRRERLQDDCGIQVLYRPREGTAKKV